MDNSKLRFRIKTRALVMFPWLSTSKSDVAFRRGTKDPFAYSASSLKDFASTLSVDQPDTEQIATSQCRDAELDQGGSLEQPAIQSKPQLPIIPALDHIDCEEILNVRLSSNKAEQRSVTPLCQATSLALPKTASDRVFATAKLPEIILLSLPTRDLFVLQRFSKFWNQATTQSVAIRQKLFLRYSSKRSEIWEMVDEQLNRVPIMATESDVMDWNHFMMTRMCGLRREPDRRQYVKFRRLAQAHNTIKGQHHLILPLTLNPLLRLSASKRQRWSLVETDEHGAYSTVKYANMSTVEDFQRITYCGSVATLQQVADMYVSDPPWPAAKMEITISCSEPGAEPHSGFIEVVNHGIKLESESGLKMADILRGLSQRDTYYSEITHGPLRNEKDWDSGLYRDEISCREKVTMAELPSKVMGRDWKGVCVRKAIKVTLRLPPIDGLMPIVPTAVELGALADD
jgi:hypothetical protein